MISETAISFLEKSFPSSLEIIDCPARKDCAMRFKELNTNSRPQAGFVGSEYDKHRILLLGQNPGRGGSDIRNVNPMDIKFYDFMERLIKTRSMQIYKEMMSYLQNKYMPTWNLFRQLNLRSSLGLSLKDIAMTNLVHCRTKGNKAISKHLGVVCFSIHTARQIELLNAKMIIAVGKVVYDAIKKLDLDESLKVEYILHPSGQYVRSHYQEQQKQFKKIRFLVGIDAESRKSMKRDEDAFIYSGVPHPSLHGANDSQTLKPHQKVKTVAKSPELAIVNFLQEKGCQKTDTEFEFGFKCGKIGIINVNNGKLWINKISSEMRSFLRKEAYGRSVKDISYQERTSYYTRYLKQRPYYSEIEHYVDFDYRQSGSDYVGIKLSAGADKLLRILKHELERP